VPEASAGEVIVFHLGNQGGFERFPLAGALGAPAAGSARSIACEACNTGDPRFDEVDEMTSSILRFSGDRLASFTCSFGAADTSEYRIVGTEGDLRLEPAYEYADKLAHFLTLGGKTKKEVFAKRDQFAPELVYFSNCIQRDCDPEPSGFEGLADVRIIEALYRSAAEGAPVQLRPLSKSRRPGAHQDIQKPPVKEEPELVHATRPHD